MENKQIVSILLGAMIGILTIGILNEYIRQAIKKYYTEEKRSEIFVKLTFSMTTHIIKYGLITIGIVFKDEKIKEELANYANHKLRIISKIFLSPPKQTTRKNKPPTIVGLFAAKKSKDNLRAAAVILFSIIMLEVININSSGVFLSITVLFLLGLFVLIVLDEILLGYRIKKGLFGTNKEEAKEIINFILKNAKENDNFNGPDGKLTIFEKVRDSFDAQISADLGYNPIPG